MVDPLPSPINTPENVEINLGREVNRVPQLTPNSWLEQRATEARQAGVGWDVFTDAINKKWEEARSAGVSDEVFQEKLGFKNPAPIDSRIRNHVATALNAVPPPDEVTGIVGAYQAGARASVVGMATNALVRGNPLPNSVLAPDASTGDRVAFGVGQFMGDLPAILLGARTGKAPGAFALPTFIKEAVTDGYENGMYKNAKDAEERIGNIALETGKSAAAGKMFGVVGGKFAQYGSKFGRPVEQLAEGLGGGTAAQITQSILSGRLPTMEELTDNALMVGVLVGGGVGASKVGPHLPSIKRNIMDRWTSLNKMPAETLQDAQTDPRLYTQLVTPPEGKPSPGSSFSHVPEGDADTQLVINREHGNFDDIAPDLLKINEPGIRYGVNAAHNPGLDLNELDPHTAMGIMHEKYWKPLGLDDVHPDIAKEVMTVAAREGLDNAQKVLDLQHEVPKLLEAPKGEEAANDNGPKTAKAAVEQIVGKETAKQLPNVIKALGDHMNSVNENVTIRKSPTIALPGESQSRELVPFTGEELGFKTREGGAAEGKQTIRAGYEPTDEDVGKVFGEGFSMWGPRELVKAGIVSESSAKAMTPKQLKAARIAAAKAMIRRMAKGFKNRGTIDSADNGGYNVPDILRETIKASKPINALADTVHPENQAPIEGGDGNGPPSGNLPTIPGEGGPDGQRPTEWANPWDKVREGMDTSKPAGSSLLKKGLEKIYQETFNTNAPLLKLWRAVRGGDPIPASDNFMYHLRDEELSSARANDRIENGLKPILKDFTPKEMEDFETYMTAFRANAEHENGIENAVDPIAARQVIANHQITYGDKFAVAIAKLIDYRKSLMMYGKDSHMWSDKDIETFTKEAKYGIPGWRVKDIPGARRPGSSIFDPVRKVKGSDEKFISPIEALVRDTIVRISIADRNASVWTLAKKAVPAGLATERPADPVQTFDADKTTSMVFKDGEWSVPNLGEGSDATLRRMFGGVLKDNEVPYFDNGIRKVLTFQDPEVAPVLRQFNDKSLPLIVKYGLAAPTRFLRNSIVKSPVFGPTILAMDTLFQLSTHPEGMRAAAGNAAIGLWHSFVPTGIWKEAERVGVVHGAFDRWSADDMVKDIMNGNADPSLTRRLWNSVNHPLEWWLTHTMSAPAVGRYARGIAAGEEPIEARAKATEAVFHRAGFGGDAGRALNLAYPFSLAHLNGLEKSSKALAIGGENEIGQKYNRMATITKALAVITVPALMAWTAYKDKKWYQDREPWRHGASIPIRIGGDGLGSEQYGGDGKDGTTIEVRLPPFVGQVFAGAPLAAANALNGHDVKWGDEVASQIMGSLVPPGADTFAPTMFTGLTEALYNKSFLTNRPLVSDAEKQNILPANQWRPYTTNTGKWLAKFVDNTVLSGGGTLTPVAADHIMRAYTGPMGMSMIQSMEHMFVTPDKPFKWQNLPIFNSMMSRYPSATAAPIDEFHSKMTLYNQVHGTLRKMMEEGNLDEFKEVLNQHPEMATMHKWAFSKETQMKMPTNASEFGDELGKTAAAGDHNLAAVNEVLKAEAFLKVSRTVASMIYANTKPEYKKLTPDERGQLLDSEYLKQRDIAAKGLEAFKQAGFK